jgi:lysyl-tRNA synthetase class 2
LQDFTMLEHYAAYWNFADNMVFTQELFAYVLTELFGRLTIPIKNRSGELVEIDFTPPWPVRSFREVIMNACGIDIDACPTADDLRAAITEKMVVVEGAALLGRGNLIDALYKNVARDQIIQPTFLTQHPIDLSPLARRSDHNPNIADRFQLVANGWELVNAYSELVDPIDQKARFDQQSDARAGGDAEAHVKDDEFVLALEHGAPPMSGWGMGIDRLVTLLTQQDNLRDSVLFPLLRPER